MAQPSVWGVSQSHEPHSVGRHLLGPHVVGQRVVVRRLVRGETGPSGGPALTDLLGVCEAFTSEAITVRPEGRASVTVPLADVVSGKPVPPRASVRDRVPAREAQVHGFALFPDLVTRTIGTWVLRDSATATARRAHSVLAFGDSGVADDVEQVLAHYERPIAAVLTGSPQDQRLSGLGWVPESTESDTLFQVAGVAQVARALRGRVGRGDAPPVDVDPGVDGQRDWVRAQVGDLASGYASFHEDWVGLGGLVVEPAHRRRGLGLAVVDALVSWGAERGATTVFLQALADNEPALALYDGLGFRTHHRYRYLVPSDHV